MERLLATFLTYRARFEDNADRARAARDKRDTLEIGRLYGDRQELLGRFRAWLAPLPACTIQALHREARP